MIVFRADKAMRKLKRVKDKDVPFLIAASITDLAKLSQDMIREEARQLFNLHTEFIPRQVKIKPAKKTQVKRYGFAVSKVFSGEKIDGWMTKHVTGGKKTPFATGGNDRGRSLAIQSTKLNKKIKTSTGRVRKAWKPRELLKLYNSLKGKSRGSQRSGTSKKNWFIIKDPGSGHAIIARRMNKRKRKPLQLAYIMVDSARIEPKWNWERITRQTVKSFKKRVFKRQIKRILKKG